MESIKGTARMTAAAKLPEKWLAKAATCRADAERLGEGNPVHNELLRDAAQYEQCAHALKLALSPAELGGVEAAVACHGLCTGDPPSRWMWIDGPASLGAMDQARLHGWRIENAYATPQPAQAGASGGGEHEKMAAYLTQAIKDSEAGKTVYVRLTPGEVEECVTLLRTPASPATGEDPCIECGADTGEACYPNCCTAPQPAAPQPQAVDCGEAGHEEGRCGNAQCMASATTPEAQEAREYRLFDSQWVNVVNHAGCYRDMNKEDAVAQAVKLTEQAMAANINDCKWPRPRKADAALALPAQGEGK